MTRAASTRNARLPAKAYPALEDLPDPAPEGAGEGEDAPAAVVLAGGLVQQGGALGGQEVVLDAGKSGIFECSRNFGVRKCTPRLTLQARPFTLHPFFNAPDAATLREYRFSRSRKGAEVILLRALRVFARALFRLETA